MSDFIKYLEARKYKPVGIPLNRRIRGTILKLPKECVKDFKSMCRMELQRLKEISKGHEVTRNIEETRLNEIKDNFVKGNFAKIPVTLTLKNLYSSQRRVQELTYFIRKNKDKMLFCDAVLAGEINIKLTRHISQFVVNYLNEVYQSKLRKAKTIKEINALVPLQEDIKILDEINSKQGVIVNGQLEIPQE